MKTIRVNKNNLDAALAAIPGSQAVSAPDYVDYDYSTDYLVGKPAPQDMVGLLLPQGMSGNQAHRLMKNSGINLDTW